MTPEVACELQLLVYFIQTGLANPSLHRRLVHFPPEELQFALRDILDWLSLRSILRDRNSAPRGIVHPITGRVLSALPQLRNYLCIVGDRLAFRIEVDAQVQQQLEDYAKDLIWHPHPTPARAGKAGDQPNLIDRQS